MRIGNKTYSYYSLKAAEANGLEGISQLPYSLKVLLENLLRNEDGRSVTRQDIEGMMPARAQADTSAKVSEMTNGSRPKAFL